MSDDNIDNAEANIKENNNAISIEGDNLNIVNNEDKLVDDNLNSKQIPEQEEVDKSNTIQEPQDKTVNIMDTLEDNAVNPVAGPEADKNNITTQESQQSMTNIIETSNKAEIVQDDKNIIVNESQQNSTNIQKLVDSKVVIDSGKNLLLEDKQPSKILIDDLNALISSQELKIKVLSENNENYIKEVLRLETFIVNIKEVSTKAEENLLEAQTEIINLKNSLEDKKNEYNELEDKFNALILSFDEERDNHEKKIKTMKDKVQNIKSELDLNFYQKLEQKEKIITDKNYKIEIQEKKIQEMNIEIQKLHSLEVDYGNLVHTNNQNLFEKNELAEVVIKQEKIINELNHTVESLNLLIKQREDEIKFKEQNAYTLLKTIEEQKKANIILINKAKSKEDLEIKCKYQIAEKEIEIKQLKNFASSLKSELDHKENFYNGVKQKISKYKEDNLKLNSIISTKTREHNINDKRFRKNIEPIIQVNSNGNSKNKNYSNLGFNDVNFKGSNNNLVKEKEIKSDKNGSTKEGGYDQDQNIQDLNNLMKKILDD